MKTPDEDRGNVNAVSTERRSGLEFAWMVAALLRGRGVPLAAITVREGGRCAAALHVEGVGARTYDGGSSEEVEREATAFLGGSP